MGTTILTIRPGQQMFGGVSRGDAQMSIEDEYLRSLRSASSYTFLAGRLALSWQAGAESGLLLFRRK